MSSRRFAASVIRTKASKCIDSTQGCGTARRYRTTAITGTIDGVAGDGVAGQAIIGGGAVVRAMAGASLRAWVCALLLVAMPALAQTVPFTGAGSQFEMVFWQSVDSGNDPALYEAYLAKYPDGTFAGVARAKLARLRPANPAAPIPAPLNLPLSAPISASGPAPAPRAPAITGMTSGAPALATAVPAPTGQTAAGQIAALPVPQVAPTPPSQSASEIENGAALRRLLGALGDSQRITPPAGALTVSPAIPSAVSPAASVTAARGAELVPVAAVSAVAGAVPPSRAVSEPSRAIVVGPLPAGFALPQRPAMAEVPGVNLPQSFCSADARNQFHNGPYIAAMDAAKRNTDASNAYMRQLQDLYDRNQLSGDINPMNALAAEARAYSPVASAAVAAQSALVSTFTMLMAVPIMACEVPR